MNTINTAIKDYSDGLKKYEIFKTLAVFDLIQKYRRSVIGPFWVTISTLFAIIVIGPLYSKLFNQSNLAYIHYLSISFILWVWISNTLNESCNLYIESSGYLREFNLPKSIYIYRLVLKNILIFFHNIIIIIILTIFFPPQNVLQIIYSLFGLIFLILNLIFISNIISILGARYRDFHQIQSNIIFLLFFITPIMWNIDMLGNKKYLAYINPVYIYIEAIRAPLLNINNEYKLIWIILIIYTIILFFISSFLFGKFKNKIIYWI